MFDLCEFGICRQARKESLDGRLQATGRNQKDEQTDGGNSEEVLGQFAKAGIDIYALAAQLQSEGAASFVKSWDELMGVISSKTASLDKTATPETVR